MPNSSFSRPAMQVHDRERLVGERLVGERLGLAEAGAERGA
jgi:hypothetical protein